MGIEKLAVVIAPKPVANVDDMKWSYSRLTSYRTCKKQFYYKYIDGRPTPANLPMSVGKIVHNALYFHIAKGFSLNESVQAAIYENNGIPEGENFGAMRRMVENAMFHVPNLTLKSEVEVLVNTRLGKIHGIIDIVAEDLLNDEVVLCDFKTGWQPSEAQGSKQLKMYAWLYKSIRGSSCPSTVKIRLIFPRINIVTEHLMTESDYVEAQSFFIKSVEAIRATAQLGEWERTCDKSSCEYCAFAGLCASELENDIFARNGEFNSSDEAVAAGNFVLQYEQYISNLKKGIRKFVEKNGVIGEGEGQWFIEPSTPKPKVTATKEWINFVEELGLEASEYLEVDAKKIETLLEHDEDGRAKQLVEWSTPRKSLKYGKQSDSSVKLMKKSEITLEYGDVLVTTDNETLRIAERTNKKLNFITLKTANQLLEKEQIQLIGVTIDGDEVLMSIEEAIAYRKKQAL